MMPAWVTPLIGWATLIVTVVFVWAVAFRARPEPAETPAPATTQKETLQ